MDKIINFGIPHVGERIFKHANDSDLLQLRSVSEVFKELSENVLVNRWQNQVFLAWKDDSFEIAKLLVDHSERKSIDLNMRDLSSESGFTAFLAACTG